jgi:hypothetical protein
MPATLPSTVPAANTCGLQPLSINPEQWPMADLALPLRKSF